MLLQKNETPYGSLLQGSPLTPRSVNFYTGDSAIYLIVMEPLFRNFINSILALNFRIYLSTGSFTSVLLDQDILDTWLDAYDEISRRQNKLKLDSLSLHEIAFIEFLHYWYRIDKEIDERALGIFLSYILKDFVKWSKKKIEDNLLQEIRFRLVELGYNDEELEPLLAVNKGMPLSAKLLSASPSIPPNATSSSRSKWKWLWRVFLLISIVLLVVLLFTGTFPSELSSLFLIIAVVFGFIADSREIVGWFRKKKN